MKDTIVVICGPTASGKTALSIGLAQRFDGEIVSADSMQIYREMDIGTAKPTLDERQGIPHFMLDVAAPGERYSVSRYVLEADACVQDILRRGKLPIVCGGTGLYIDGLIRGTEFQPEGVGTGLRDELEARWERDGAEGMLAQLRQVDPESAARLHPNDKRRILRALEVFCATGETISEHNRRTGQAERKYRAVKIGLTAEPRQVLYDRIDRRVDVMVQNGLVDEVRGLMEAGKLTGTAEQAIGYKEIAACLRGACSLEEACELVKRKSRNYAKRQLTWFRRDEDIHWIVYNDPQSGGRVLQDSTEYLKKMLYNDDEKT